jgi:hypothetical protein
MQTMQFALVSALTLASCHTVSAGEFAGLARRAKIRCLVVERDLAVISPFNAGKTDLLVTEVRRNLMSLEELFEVDVPPSLLVIFEMIGLSEALQREDHSSVWDLNRSRHPSRHGVTAYAVSSPEASTVTVYVAPEFTLNMKGGKEIPFKFDPAVVRATIRHELAHVCAKHAGLDGPRWFDEGLAEELESWELTETGTFIAGPLPSSLRLARDGHAPFTIDTVLDWEEDAGQVLSGQEAPFLLGRPLAHSLMRFLLEKASGETLRQKLKEILALDRNKIRALGGEWKIWMESLPDDS